MLIAACPMFVFCVCLSDKINSIKRFSRRIYMLPNIEHLPSICIDTIVFPGTPLFKYFDPLWINHNASNAIAFRSSGLRFDPAVDQGGIGSNQPPTMMTSHPFTSFDVLHIPFTWAVVLYMPFCWLYLVRITFEKNIGAGSWLADHLGHSRRMGQKYKLK